MFSMNRVIFQSCYFFDVVFLPCSLGLLAKRQLGVRSPMEAAEGGRMSDGGGGLRGEEREGKARTSIDIRIGRGFYCTYMRISRPFP